MEEGVVWIDGCMMEKYVRTYDGVMDGRRKGLVCNLPPSTATILVGLIE